MNAETTPPSRAAAAPAADAFFALARAADPALAGDVVGLTGYEETGRGHLRQLQAASLIVPMIISFKAPFLIGLGRSPQAHETFGTFAAGLFAGPVVIESFGDSACVQVDFTPRGARRFFALPLCELAARMVPLEDLLGRPVLRLRERLAEEPDWSRRLDLAEAFVRARLAARPPASPVPGHAYAWLSASHGRMKIGSIARQLGCSRRHLADSFRHEFGLGPKTVGRLIRFRRAVALAQEGTESWAGVAAAAGYADQAHMSRDFAAFAGAPPERWRHRAP